MSFLAEDDDGVAIRPHLRKVRDGGRSGVRRGSGLSGSLLNKWNFAEGSRAAVFKKIASGGTHNRNQMRRQMDYINTKAQYTFGFSDALSDDRRQSEASLEAIADSWEASWRGAPRNGHTSHLLISFPPDTASRDAAAIAEEMCERAFGGEKEFADDRWEYIAALHTDRSHPHVHVLVNNRGVENGSWFYLSNKLEAPFTYQGFRNLMVSVAQEYGVQLEATTRYARGDLQYSPSSAQWRKGREPGQRALSDRVLGMLIDEADEWGEVATVAKMVGNARVAEVAERMIQGIATQSPISRKDFEMVLENVETAGDFEAAVKGWVDDVRDTVLTLPPDMQGKHFAEIDGVLSDMKRDYGLVIEVEGIAHPGPMANSLHADGDLLARRAEDYVPEGRDIGRETLAAAVDMFSAGVSDEDEIRKFENAKLANRQAAIISEVEKGVIAQFDGEANEFTKFEPLVTGRDGITLNGTNVCVKAELGIAFTVLANEREGGGLSVEDQRRADALLRDTAHRYGEQMRDGLVREDTREFKPHEHEDFENYSAQVKQFEQDRLREFDEAIRPYDRQEVTILSEGRIRDYTMSLRAVELANVDYSFEARPGAVADFWQKFEELSGDAGIDWQYAEGVFENDLLSDDQKREVLSSAVDPERGSKISADEMFDRVQELRGEMRANIMTPDRDYLRSFMQRLTEREYPSAAPEFANRESEREYAAALRAEFGTRGFERMAEGDYRDLESITPNRLHQRELAASVLAMAERPEHAAKFDLSREQIAQGYAAADEPHKAQRALGQSSTGDDFSL